MPDGFRITQQVPGGEPVDLTRAVTSASWSSAVNGGFGAASLTIPRLLTQKERGLLGGITIEHEGRVLFEGRVEDAFFSGERGSLSTELQAFGLQRLLSDNSVRRIWSLRDLPVETQTPQGSSSTGTIQIAETSNEFGYYDNSGYILGSQFGYGVNMQTLSAGTNQGSQVVFALPTGITGARLMFDAYIYGGPTSYLLVHSSADGTTFTRHLEQSVGSPQSVSVNVALVAGATQIRITAGIPVIGVGAVVMGSALTNIRVLGTPLREDAPGGFYGGTILRDVLALADGISAGTIEDGSDLAIAEFARVNRASVLEVVQEIASLYAREWGVWEGGRFDWITPDLKAGGWLVPLEVATAWRIEQSIDSVQKRTYVSFTDAADNQIKEAVAESTNARNPYVRTGTAKDGIVAAPAAMTSVTAPLLAAKLNNDFGRWPDIKGSVTLLAQTIVSQTGNGARAVPAFAIRAGDNITIPDLPVEDIYAAGQDGQTVFHVTGVAASTGGTVQLTLEGLTRRADVLLARLGASS